MCDARGAGLGGSRSSRSGLQDGVEGSAAAPHRQQRQAKGEKARIVRPCENPVRSCPVNISGFSFELIDRVST
jgi:hypothetical protein